jgi:hypothetical protein
MKKKLFILSLFATIINFAQDNLLKDSILFQIVSKDSNNITPFYIEKNSTIPFYNSKTKVINQIKRNDDLQLSFKSENQTYQKLEVYPNPFNNIFTVGVDSDSKIEIYNLLGKIIKTKNVSIGSFQFDMTNFASGVYFLKVTNDKNSSKTIKIIKE